MNTTTLHAGFWAVTFLAALAQAEEATPPAIKTNALLQTWVVNDVTAAARPNFRLRRAEVKFSGSVVENTKWFVMVDPAKSLKTGAVAATNDNKILQDLGLACTAIEGFEFTIGQFKTPATAEGADSSGDLPMIERSVGGRVFGDKREPGFLATYKAGVIKASGSVTNGNGTNVDDTNGSKDLTLRVDVNPVDPLKLGVSTVAGDFSYGAKSRFGGSARLALGDFRARTEATLGRDSGTKSTGWTLEADYALGSWMPVARVQGYTKSDATGTEIAGGCGYSISGNAAKIQATYGLLKNLSGAYGSPTLAKGLNGTQLVIAFQMAI